MQGEDDQLANAVTWDKSPPAPQATHLFPEGQDRNFSQGVPMKTIQSCSEPGSSWHFDKDKEKSVESLGVDFCHQANQPQHDTTQDNSFLMVWGHRSLLE